MAKLPFESKGFLGKRLCELRLYFGFRQEDIANVLHVSRPAYTCYESGKTQPDYVALGKLAAYYDVPVSVFYDPVLKLGVDLHDPQGRKRRTTRVVPEAVDVAKIGDLRPAERSLILLLRSNGIVDAADLLQYLRTRLPKLQEEQEGK